MDAVDSKGGQMTKNLQDAGHGFGSVEICMQPGCRKGYVWSAEGAVNLRRHFTLLGSFLGGVATFKSQVAVEGLPLELGLDEVALAVCQGWAHVSPPALENLHSVLIPPTSEDVRQEGGLRQPAAMQSGRQRKRKLVDADEPDQQVSSQGMHSTIVKSNGDSHRPWAAYLTPPNLKHVHWLAEYYAYCEAAGLYGNEAKDGTVIETASIQGSLAETNKDETADIDMPGTSQVATSQMQETAHTVVETVLEPPTWKAAVQEGASFTIPWTRANRKPTITGHAASMQAPDNQQSMSDQIQGCIQHEQQLPAMEHQPEHKQGIPDNWKFSANRLESIRHMVFKDLHSKGYAMSAGPKFGCDMLAYPGDPSLYHAQFTVRILEADQVINPIALKGAARGSHAARKHMLFATVLPSDQQDRSDSPRYLTFAPEAGFGKSS